jgi:hypothetical protein
MVTTLSSRRLEAAAKDGLAAFTTHWVIPKWSRRSTKRSCP